MLPRNIDLTANRDFSGGGRINFTGLLRTIDLDAEAMSTDEYEVICWWEGIFGRKRHYNEKNKVFDEDRKYYERWRDTCVRCGKPLRCPWKRAGELCVDCAEVLDTSRLPWIEYYGQQAWERDRTMDIFSMR